MPGKQVGKRDKSILFTVRKDFKANGTLIILFFLLWNSHLLWTLILSEFFPLSNKTKWFSLEDGEFQSGGTMILFFHGWIPDKSHQKSEDLSRFPREDLPAL